MAISKYPGAPPTNHTHDPLNTALGEGQSHEDKSLSKYLSQDNGLYLNGPDGGRKRLSSPLEVTALTSDQHGGSWGRLVQLQDPNGKTKEIAIPMSTIISSSPSCLTLLSDLGLRLADQDLATRKAIIDYLTNAEVEDRLTNVDRPGWHGDTYVLPHRTFGPPGTNGQGRVVLQDLRYQQASVGSRGSLEEWQEGMGRYLSGNSRLLFPASVALAAPLLYPIGETESGGFHFFGGSSIGKTTALQVAGSMWGGGGANGYIQSWRATDNSLEYVAEAHCDALLCLDEIGLVNPRQVGEIAYMLANGEGKSRARKDGGVQRKPTWRLLFLSSGEMKLVDKMSEGGLQTRAGQENRLVDIPADAGAGLGIFEDLHDLSDPGSLALHLKTASQAFYGTAAEKFLAILTKEMSKGDNQLIKMVKTIRDKFEQEHVPKKADGQVFRVGKRFSLVAAAGELGIKWGILPCSKGDSIWAASKCFKDWLDHRGGEGPGEQTAILSQVRHFLETQQIARFISPDDVLEDRFVRSLAGYIKTFRSGRHAGRSVFAIMPEVFRREVTTGYDRKQVSDVLIHKGYLLTDADGRSDIQVKISGRNIRCYCIDQDFLGEIIQDAGDDSTQSTQRVTDDDLGDF
jgi:putative DNA primase/helicase